jgi:hypothetical protein
VRGQWAALPVVSPKRAAFQSMAPNDESNHQLTEVHPIISLPDLGRLLSYHRKNGETNAKNASYHSLMQSSSSEPPSFPPTVGPNEVFSIEDLEPRSIEEMALGRLKSGGDVWE